MGAVSLDRRLSWLGIVAATVAIALLLLPPIPQDPAYHDFADQRGWLGIPNFFNVVSNLPFVLVGVRGFHDSNGRLRAGMLAGLRPAYPTFFAGVALTGVGSAYYHWNPNNSSLLWDRLPMTIAFMALFAVIVGEFISVRAGRTLLWPLIMAGAASVFYWGETESLGQGDLRPYLLVQFLPLLLIPLIMMLFSPALVGTVYLWVLLLAYLAAKVAEWLDAPLFELLAPLSGHSLKHLLAAMGTYSFLLAVRRRYRPATKYAA